METLALSNMFKKKQPNTRFAKVTERVNKFRYKVVDVYGRTWSVNAHTSWKIGDDVVVQLDWITGAGQKVTAPKEFSV